MPETNTSSQEIGIVKSVRGFLVFLEGLPTIKINDMVESEGSVGVVSALLGNLVSVYMLEDTNVKPGQIFTRIDRSLTIQVGEFLLGRIIDPLGTPIDGKKMLGDGRRLSLEKKAPSIWSRRFISEQFFTGITLVDTLVPLGKGQRELVIGDARSGKTSFLIDLIVNQKDSGVICIYASIGKAITDVKRLSDILFTNKAFTNTIVVAASSSDPPPLIFLAPKTAFTIAEYFQTKGKDVLLILDDMGNHAKIYREMALLQERPPGRESYPGDMFYQHAYLLERAGCFNETEGGGSITALPVIELNLTDFTTYIPTNLMSMTDGHLMFTSALHNQGMRPAINIPLSVTRVGLQTQNRVQNGLAGAIKSILARATQLESLSRFSAELPEETQLLLHQKELIEEFIVQDAFVRYERDAQTLSLALVFINFLKDKDKYFVRLYKKKLMDAFLEDVRFKPLIEIINKGQTAQELLDSFINMRNTLEEICSLQSK